MLALGACHETPFVGSTIDATMEVPCVNDEVLCGGQCVSLRNNSAHCGLCGAPCFGGQTCVGGACVCPAGTTSCVGLCVDLRSDRDNCGGCGTSCGNGDATCVAGECTCPHGLRNCFGTCRDITSDDRSCGRCGWACDSGRECVNSNCVNICRIFSRYCNGVCTDVRRDHANCGECGRTCPSDQVCREGWCRPPCPTSSTECLGECRFLLSDEGNCGYCGRVCASSEVCSEGTCQLTCAAGTTACSGECRDTQTDIANCGRCGTACRTGEACTDGACVARCFGGLTGCADVCRDLLSDRTNCGACGRVCTSEQVCSNGACQESCDGGLRNCSGVCLDAQSDRGNCGSCGRTCAIGEVCSNGACATNCGGGLTDCNGTCRDTQTDLANCGACERACAIGEVCSNGACTANCARGLTRCWGRCRYTSTDNNHCGACGRACAMGQVCSAGTCQFSCQAGATNCGGLCRDLQSDARSCGACSNACGAGRECLRGACQTQVTEPPRPVAPLSTSTVTSQQATLRWVLPTGATGARVQVCRDRACDLVVQQLDVTGSRATLSTALAAGPYFWRLYPIADGQVRDAQVSPVWEFFVGARSAPVDSSSGTVFDVNGDGFADVVVGAPGESSQTGRVYVFLGSRSGVSSTPAITLTGPGGTYGRFGRSVSSAGDVNGDGFADLVVGAPIESLSTGRVYVFFGSSRGLSPTPATTLTYPGGINGRFGESVASAGDVNGDGFADLVVGAWGGNRALVYFGSSMGLSAARATTLRGPTRSAFGVSVASAGDLNGDGFAELVVGASNPGDEYPFSQVDCAYLYLGSGGELSITSSMTFNCPGGTRGGESVAGAGDINGDGLTDLLVGSSHGTDLYLGNDRSLIDPTATRLVLPTDSPIGLPVASAGDVNGDGFADVVGRTFFSNNVFVFHGNGSGVRAMPSTALIVGSVSSRGFGHPVMGVGDVNGDGFADVVVGSPDEFSETGRIYVFLGSRSGVSSTPAIVLTGPGGVSGWFGWSVARVGGVSCDGFADRWRHDSRCTTQYSSRARTRTEA